MRERRILDLGRNLGGNLVLDRNLGGNLVLDRNLGGNLGGNLVLDRNLGGELELNKNFNNHKLSRKLSGSQNDSGTSGSDANDLVGSRALLEVPYWAEKRRRCRKRKSRIKFRARRRVERERKAAEMKAEMKVEMKVETKVNVDKADHDDDVSSVSVLAIEDFSDSFPATPAATPAAKRRNIYSRDSEETLRFCDGKSPSLGSDIINHKENKNQENRKRKSVNSVNDGRESVDSVSVISLSSDSSFRTSRPMATPILSQLSHPERCVREGSDVSMRHLGWNGAESKTNLCNGSGQNDKCNFGVSASGAIPLSQTSDSALNFPPSQAFSCFQSQKVVENQDGNRKHIHRHNKKSNEIVLKPTETSISKTPPQTQNKALRSPFSIPYSTQTLSTIRWVPKAKGMRPLINLKRRNNYYCIKDAVLVLKNLVRKKRLDLRLGGKKGNLMGDSISYNNNLGSESLGSLGLGGESLSGSLSESSESGFLSESSLLGCGVLNRMEVFGGLKAFCREWNRVATVREERLRARWRLRAGRCRLI